MADNQVVQYNQRNRKKFLDADWPPQIGELTASQLKLHLNSSNADTNNDDKPATRTAWHQYQCTSRRSGSQTAREIEHATPAPYTTLDAAIQ